MNRSPVIVLASGGTGGHLFPAESLAQVLLERGYGVALVTDARGAEFASKHPDIEVHQLPVRRGGRSPASKMSQASSIAAATARASGHLRRIAPALVTGFGGYPSFPTVMAAQMLGIPTVLHEQNTIAGRANRPLSWLADAVATSFPSVQGLKADKLVHVGHPVRAEFERLRGRDYHAPHGDEPIRLLVTGGSQGASIFATVVPAALAALPETLRRRLHVAQQCRAEDLDAVTARYRETGVEAETAVFFTDLPRRLADAHVAIGRSGASTVIENAMAGCPSIYVPLPTSLTGEQAANAWFMETAGAAIMVKQPSFTPDYLATRLDALLNDPERLVRMAHAARDAGKPNAAANLADLIGEVLEGQHPRAEVEAA